MSDTCSILSSKHCVPCEGGVPPLDAQEIAKLLADLQHDWQVNNIGHLYKHYEFKNFMDAMSFANEIALIAEEEGHHPNLIISWGACDVEIWTHKIDGLSESDFILAAKIEELYI
jgi:4a-hydroxytetrahydrobiopterin dehydratase